MTVKQILCRFYTNNMDESIKLYEELLNEKCRLRVNHNQNALELAQIGNVLLISGSNEELKPFVETKATFLVDSVMEFKSFLLDNGATIVRDITKVTTGYNLTMKNTDGTIIEYVEFQLNQ